MPLLSHVANALLRAYSRVAPTERGGYRLVRAARRLRPAETWRGPFRTPDQITLELDLATYPDCCMAYGLYELDTHRRLKAYLRPGMRVVDCGANLGYFTLLAGRLVGPTGHVDAFEPDPANRARLEAHLGLNEMHDRVTVHAAAVSNQAGTCTLYHPTADGQNHGQASLYEAFVPGGQGIDVPLVRLDQHLSAVPDLIKMDIEGAELAALRGAEGLLKSDRPPAMIIEHNPASALAAGWRPDELFDYIRSVQPRYRVYWIGWRLSRIDTAQDLALISRQGNLWITAE